MASPRFLALDHCKDGSADRCAPAVVLCVEL